jgi:hypothetical protein
MTKFLLLSIALPTVFGLVLAIIVDRMTNRSGK